MGPSLPPIPAKRYFTIGETSLLCAVKPHVLRYWEQEFSQLRPMKRAGNRRYYQHHEVLMIRKIRSLLYENGFTISGARQQLQEPGFADQYLDGLAQEPCLSEPQAPAQNIPTPDPEAITSDAYATIAAIPDDQREAVCNELIGILQLLKLD